MNEAVTYLKRALAIQPDSANKHYQLGQAYLKLGERAQAQKEFAEQAKLQAEARDQQGDRMTGRLPESSRSSP